MPLKQLRAVLPYKDRKHELKFPGITNSVLEHPFNPSTRDTKGGEFQAILVYIEFYDSQSYLERP